MNLFKYLTHDTQMMKESFSNKLVPKWESLLEENQENPSKGPVMGFDFRALYRSSLARRDRTHPNPQVNLYYVRPCFT